MKNFCIYALIILTISCSSNGTADKSARYAYDESEPEQITTEEREDGDRELSSSLASMDNVSDTTLRLKKTADIEFKTSDMLEATQGIEDIVLSSGGYIGKTHLSTDILNNYTYKITEDSVMRVMRLRRINNLELRIPSSELHVALKKMTPYMSLLNHRNIDVENIALQLKAEELKRRRLQEYQSRLASKSSAAPVKKLDDITQAEDQLLLRQEQKDNALLKSMELNDELRYSKVTLRIYQDPLITYSKERTSPKETKYTEPYSNKLADSFATGWAFITSLFLGIVTLWPLWIILAVLYVVLKKVLYKKK